jgi:hypothetical protein
MIGVAAGGGLLLASLTGRKSRSRRHYAENLEDSGRSEHRRGMELQKNKALETFDNIKGAVIAVAANTFQDFLGQLIPGFKQELDKTVQQKRSGLSSDTPNLATRAAGAP